MRYLHQVVRTDGSSRQYEEWEYEDALADYNARGVSMTKLRLYYTLENDPQAREFDQSDDAEKARLELIAPLQANVDVAFEKKSHYVPLEV